MKRMVPPALWVIPVQAASARYAFASDGAAL
jgi:hypothetical protein